MRLWYRGALKFAWNTEMISVVACAIFTQNEPAHEIIVLITQATSEGSGKPAHPRNLVRAFAVHIRKVWK